MARRQGGHPLASAALCGWLLAALLVFDASPVASQSSCALAGTAALALTATSDLGGAYATCYARFSVRVDSNCSLWVLPAVGAAKGTYSALWSPVAVRDARTQQACPSSTLSAGPLPAQTSAGVAAALKAVLGASLLGSQYSAVADARLNGAGVELSVQAPESDTLSFAVVEGGLGRVLSAGSWGCQAAGSPCAYSAASGCPAGRHKAVAGAGTLCALCPPGAACTGGEAAPQACTAGAAAVAGSASCSPCAPGSFAASAGLSHCTLAPAGSYQDQPGQTAAKPCPAPSDSHFPGSTACLACYFGAPLVYAGAGGAYPDSVPDEQPSAGVLVATTSAASPLSSAASCGFNPLIAGCSTMDGRTLALSVDASCRVTVSVLDDSACSQQDSLFTLSGAFADVDTIQLALPASSASAVSMQAALLPAVGTLAVTFFELTTLFDRPLASLRVCTDTLAMPANATACPAGTAPEQNPQGGEGGVSVRRLAQCAPCDAGSQCNGTHARPCTAGTYSSLLGSTFCEACPNNAVSGSGADTCQQCSVGTTPAPSRDACQLCSDSARQPGEHSCGASCPAGSYPNSAECSRCLPGEHSATGAMACTPCAPGTAATDMGTPTDPQTGSCPACPLGYFASGQGAHFCNSCPAGAFSNTTGSAQCTPCAPGFVTEADGGVGGASRCVPCPVGTYKKDEENRCHSCPSGYETRLNGTGAWTCTPCLPGFASSLPNSPLCSPCPPGSFAPDSGSRRCQACSAGFVTGLEPTRTGQMGRDATGASTCQPCPGRTFRPSMTASNTCITCPVGRETRVPFGATSCIACAPGTSLPSITSVSCQACVAGTFAPRPGSLGSCPPCPPGSYTPDDGNSECQPCEPGTYQDTPGSLSCKECPEGTFSGAVGGSTADSCRPCPMGSFAAGNGNDGCLTCEGGSFQDKTGQGVCKDCPPGFGCPAGAIAPMPCPAGYYSAGRTPYCKPCTPGTFNPLTQQRACRPCGVGTYCPRTGMIAAVACPAGTFGTKFGAMAMGECRKCPVNTFSAVAGLQRCGNCPPGQWTGRMSGQKMCWSTSLKLPRVTKAAKASG